MSSRRQLKQYYFTLMFWIWVLPQSLKLTSLNTINYQLVSTLNTIGDYLVLGMSVFFIIYFQRYSLRDLIKIVILAVLAGISAISCKNFSLVSLLVIVVDAKDINIELLLKKYARFIIVFTIIIVVCGSTGILTDVTQDRDGVLRHSMGFNHPNVLGIEIAEFTIIYIYT